MEFEVSTQATLEVRDVSDRVQENLPDGTDGTCTVFCPHTTAGVTVNESESRLIADIEQFLGSIVPNDGWKHDRLDGNTASHLRALVLGPSVTIPVSGGNLATGSWQSILLVECDGPRTRTVEVVV